MKINSISRGHAALRIGRVSLERQIYLITVCCVDRKRFLGSHDSACAAARTLHKLHIERHIHLHAWVLMPDHMHLVLELKPSQTLATSIGRINSCVAKAINQALIRKGAVWQGAYHDHAMRKDEDMQKAIRYLLNNPIRAGLVESIEKYSYWNILEWQGPLLNLNFD